MRGPGGSRLALVPPYGPQRLRAGAGVASASRRAVLLLLAAALTGCTGGGGAGTAVPDPTPAPRRTPPPAVDGCPASFPTAAPQPWVPAAPTTDTAGRLAPDADPVEVLLCRYGTSGELAGSTGLQAGLDQVRTDLGPDAAPAGTCPPASGGVPHLARLRYADGELWLSGRPGQACGGNGVFVTRDDVGQLLAAAAEAGRWVSPVSG